jgi:hypothetical protein
MLGSPPTRASSRRHRVGAAVGLERGRRVRDDLRIRLHPHAPGARPSERVVVVVVVVVRVCCVYVWVGGWVGVCVCVCGWVVQGCAHS